MRFSKRAFSLATLGASVLLATAALAHKYDDAPAPTRQQAEQACRTQYSPWNDPTKEPAYRQPVRIPTEQEFAQTCTCMANQLLSMGDKSGPIFAAMSDPALSWGSLKTTFQLNRMRTRGAYHYPDGTWVPRSMGPNAQAARRFADQRILNGEDPETVMASMDHPTDRAYGTEGIRIRIAYTQFFEKAITCGPSYMSQEQFANFIVQEFFSNR